MRRRFLLRSVENHDGGGKNEKSSKKPQEDVSIDELRTICTDGGKNRGYNNNGDSGPKIHQVVADNSLGSETHAQAF